jgi:puromycin-sensitive aminopeptidase
MLLQCDSWGLVTYRETALLVDPKMSSASTKQWVALVVGHELAHQWFGNLVTMEWWTQLWLNEGFATWIEYLCVDKCFPDWKIWTQFVYQDMARAYALDALLSSHPIEVPVGHPDEVDEIFDEISYSKGSTVIRMLHGYLGEEAVKRGLNIYLNKHQYSNTITEDLWAALQESSGKPVPQMMDTWTKQMGYPVITVRDTDTPGKFHLVQTRFLASEVASGDNAAALWFVPIGVTYPSKVGDTKQLISSLQERESDIEITDLVDDAWIKLNPQQTGYALVHCICTLLHQANTVACLTYSWCLCLCL